MLFQKLKGKTYIFLGFSLPFLFITFFWLKNLTLMKKSGNFIIENGNGYFSIGRKLFNEGYIKDLKVFSVYYRALNTIYHFEPKIGEYEIKNGESFYSVIKRINNGDVLYRKISFPEGLETREIIELINNDKNLIGENLSYEKFPEGVFMPDTYLFTYPTTKMDIIKILKNNMETFVLQKWETKTNKILKDKNDLLTLASVIQKEAANLKEMPIISGVFVNRITKGIKLGSDPTTRYEITKGKYRLVRPLNFNDLKIKGDYNTYTKSGLPKRPICNPGKDAILAVLNPIETNYIYFVANPDGSGHIFNEGFEDHIESAKLYRNMRKDYYKGKNAKEKYN